MLLPFAGSIMTAFLTCDSLTAATPDGRTLFDNLTFAVGAERVALVGRNGSGKSTLLRIALGDVAPAGGSVSRRGRVAMLLQHWPETWSVARSLGVADALAASARIDAGGTDAADWEVADWTVATRAAAALARVALDGLPLDTPIARLSGGERTRVGLAQMMLDPPDLLLLDEPTNNLDATGRAMVQALVDGRGGGLLLASHDRALLERVDRIIELSPVGVRQFGGNWSAFAAAREADRARREAEVDRAEHDLQTTRRTVQTAREAKARRDRAGQAFADRGSEPRILLGQMARRAEASAGRLARAGDTATARAEATAQAARARVEVIAPVAMDVPRCGIPPHADVLALDAVTVQRGARRLGPWTLALRGPERVAVTGANGAGKSTLLRVAMGDRAPTTGEVRRAEGRIAMLDQHVGLLDADAAIIDNYLRLHPTASGREGYAACAHFAFRNREAERPVASLSGGERLRAGLACALGGPVPPWLLLLDEPTNHLDLDSVAELERALSAYDGALLVVSHDAAFLDAIGIARRFPAG
jgi:ATPase subunit of ABC transporter with duplicated ATPase domains